ncbi:hypothetical protein [Acinetobacter baumannii]|uniref:hypothetical protein n=1 Tax=Acinetobacter baumannii TaxID=470 RepID=UPI003F5E496D
MKNSIFLKLFSILFIVFGTYLFLLFLYDLYFYKHLYNKVCSILYCLEFIEFKDYASILATLIGSAFVAYSLFSWKDTFRFNIIKNDIERFRQASHNLLKNIDMQRGCFLDCEAYIKDKEDKGIPVKEFKDVLYNYELALEDITNKRFSTIALFHDFRFERNYFIIHGGNNNKDDFNNSFKTMISRLDHLHNDFENNDIPSFKVNIIEFNKAYEDFHKKFIDILGEIYYLLNK